MSITDAFADVMPAAAPARAVAPAAPTAARVAEKATGKTRRASGVRAAMIADVRGAWLWDAHGLTVRSLWEQRIPALERVPAESRALQAGWVAYNHAALVVLAPALFALYLLGHPARTLLAAAVAAPLTALWIYG